MSAHIYIISDDSQNLQNLQAVLSQEGYIVSDTAHLSEDLEQLQPDLVILDLAMQDGLDRLCSEIRSYCADLPILFIANRADAQLIATMLDAGGDDVLRKPFASRELLARLRVLLRWRVPFEEQKQVRLMLDSKEQVVMVNQRRVHLTPVEFQLLKFLCQNQNQYYTALDLLQILWSYPPHAGDTALVRNHIRNLRSKLEPDPDHPHVLVSQYGRGYTVRGIVQQS